MTHRPRPRNAQVKQVWLRLKGVYNLNYIHSGGSEKGGGQKQLHFDGLPAPPPYKDPPPSIKVCYSSLHKGERDVL
jgi:hypothetical protein